MCSHFFCTILCFNAINTAIRSCDPQATSMHLVLQRLVPAQKTREHASTITWYNWHYRSNVLAHSYANFDRGFFRCGIPQLTQRLSVIDEFITCVQFYSLFCVMLSARLEYIRQIRGNPVCSRGMCHTEYSLIQLRSDAHFTITSFDLMLLPQKKKAEMEPHARDTSARWFFFTNNWEHSQTHRHMDYPQAN